MQMISQYEQLDLKLQHNKHLLLLPLSRGLEEFWRETESYLLAFTRNIDGLEDQLLQLRVCNVLHQSHHGLDGMHDRFFNTIDLSF